MSNDPEIAYRAACVFSLTSLIEKEDQKRAIVLLEQAIKGRYRGISKMIADSDLDAIRRNPKFQKLSDAISSLYQ